MSRLSCVPRWRYLIHHELDSEKMWIVLVKVVEGRSKVSPPPPGSNRKSRGGQYVPPPLDRIGPRRMLKWEHRPLAYALNLTFLCAIHFQYSSFTLVCCDHMTLRDLWRCPCSNKRTHEAVVHSSLFSSTQNTNKWTCSWERRMREARRSLPLQNISFHTTFLPPFISFYIFLSRSSLAAAWK